MTNEIPEGCLPFDLEKALNGWPCVTRDGREVRISFVSELDIDNDYPLLGWVFNGDKWITRKWNKNGNHDSQYVLSSYNLFLKKKTKTYYVNIYKGEDGIYARDTFLNEENSKSYGLTFRQDQYIKTISFEVDDEI